MKEQVKTIFSIPFQPLELSAYISPEGPVCEWSGRKFYRKMATIQDLEDYFALGFRYLYVEAAGSHAYWEKEVRQSNEDKTDLMYILDLAVEYEKIHGVGSCPCLILDSNVLAAQSHWIEFTDEVKADIKRLYLQLKANYPTVFAGYMLRDEPYLWFLPYFVEVYDYLYNELGAKDLVYLWSFHPAGGASFPHDSSSIYISMMQFDNGKIDVTGYQEFLKNNDYGITEANYMAEYTYYLDSYARAFREKGIENVLFGCDFYPYREVEELLCYNYPACLNTIALIVKRYGYKMFLAIQSYFANPSPMTPLTTSKFLYQQAYVALAFGVRHLSYFTYLEHFSQNNNWVFEKAMVMWKETNGKWTTEKTEYYDWVKELNAELLMQYSKLTAFDWVGTIVKKGANLGVLEKQQYLPAYVDENLTVLENDEDVIVGCLENKDTGIKAYLLVNFSYPLSNAKTKIRFSYIGTLYDENECVISNSGEYIIDIPCGGAKMVFVK